ncbi:uncharacterized protein LODBEIA_P54920 [Lodderomyces beijingensis]|uniref:Uncharacterized protein n=1 Tax=Lodderomyces beijingensis TaxID=1775926 RepID=A0ABP0ZUD7_9ASCO
MGYLTITLVGVIILYALLKCLTILKTVPDEYLQQQSYVDATRLPNESAIHKSIKKPMLRVGLDIRYDQYKLRSGNLQDVWSIVINSLHSDQNKGIAIDGDKMVTFGYINYCIREWKRRQAADPVTAINIPVDHKVDARFVVAVLIGFVLQIPVQLYQGRKNPVSTARDEVDLTEMDLPGGGNDFVFENVYSPAKDKGIALRFVKQVRPGIDVLVEYTQLNIISAVASSIKHLPYNFDASRKSITIVPHSSIEGTMDLLVKLLMAFVVDMNVHINYDPDFSTDITSLPDSAIYRQHQQQLHNSSNWLRLRLRLRQVAYNHGIFKSAKLIYVQSQLSKPGLTSQQRNQLAVSHDSHVIQEYQLFNVMGPVLLTDMFEHRTYGAHFGQIAQSLEMKLVNVDTGSGGVGNVMIRGYTIGKSTHYINGEVAPSDHAGQYEKKDDGFMPLPSGIRGKFGTDGCLYLS